MALTPISPDGQLEAGGLANADSQAQFRQQIANLTALVQQVVGNAAAVEGSLGPSDPIVSPFTLHVNPYIGSDVYRTGFFNDHEATGTQSEVIAQKLKRISNQQITAGYSPQRPFRTINRAALEVALITSAGHFTINDPEAHVDCPLIVLSAGNHTVYNDPGELDATPISEWTDGYIPTSADLAQFNSPSGGVILPRYCSFEGADLRKVTIRPTYVPVAADELADYSNRSAIFGVTASGRFSKATFMDKLGLNASHHLLSVFAFAGKRNLDTYYLKIKKAFEVPSGLNPSLVVTRPTEWQIAAPVGQSNPTQAWDGTSSASPYVWDCTVRSNYGMGGIFADGTDVGGFKSFVTANFTGVSLQTDLNGLEVYDAGVWRTPVSYQEYILADADDKRYKPAWATRHITAINDAFAQLVSIFTIGQAIQVFADQGGELRLTNSNSSFGGCAAAAKSYKNFAVDLDKNWQTKAIRNATDLRQKTGNIRQITLGFVANGVSNAATTIVLDAALENSLEAPGVPRLLAKDGYSLREDSYLWIENTAGPDYRAPLAAVAWDPLNPDQIAVKAVFENEDGQEAGEEIASGTISVLLPNLEGKRVYVRRLADTRTEAERRWSLEINNTAPTRTPVPTYVLQTDTAAALIDREFSSSELLIISRAGRRTSENTGTDFDAEITLRKGNSAEAWAPSTFYRRGDHVLNANKHFTALRTHMSGPTFDGEQWGQEFVHMPSDFSPEGALTNEAPIITFDNDTDGLEKTSTCGYDLIGDWATDSELINQYRSATDYQGIHLFLTAMGFSSAEAHNLLLPRAAETRSWPTDVARLGYLPSGAANGWGNWSLQMRRSSVVNLSWHSMEWAGTGNYSTGLPVVRKELSPQNQFTYYFTNWNGGRVILKAGNELGLEITPKGVEDTSTGETLSVDRIGSSDDELNLGDTFDVLNARELNVTGPAQLTSISGPGGSTINWDPQALPFASTIKAGIVELATSLEARGVFTNGTASTDADTDAQRALSLSAIPGLKSAILEAVRLLEPRYRYIYLHSGITYTYENGTTGATSWEPGAVAEYSSIPNEIWEDVKHFRNIHELNTWTGIAPPPSSPQAALAGELCFRDMEDAYEFLGNRKPSDGKEIFLMVYGPSIGFRKSARGRIHYRNSTHIFWAKGRSQPLVSEQGPTIFMDGTEYLFDANGELSLVDVNINCTGTAAQPDKYNKLQTTIRSDLRTGNSRLNIYNVRFFGRQSWNGWVIMLDVATIAIHTRKANIGNSSDSSVVEFDVKTSTLTQTETDFPSRGNFELTRSRYLEVKNQRSLENTIRKLIYKIDTEEFKRGALTLHLIYSPGAATLTHRHRGD